MNIVRKTVWRTLDMAEETASYLLDASLTESRFASFWKGAKEIKQNKIEK